MITFHGAPLFAQCLSYINRGSIHPGGESRDIRTDGDQLFAGTPTNMDGCREDRWTMCSMFLAEDLA